MKITKYEHACLVVEDRNQILVIDPGAWSPSAPTPTNVVAIVITHVHQDHFYPEKLGELVTANPGVKIYSTEEVKKEAGSLPIDIATVGQTISAGPFELSFFGGEHAIIHSSYPKFQNIGLLVNKLLFYPGDSFCKSDEPPKVLAVPASAPWMKIADAMDYIQDLRPQTVFPTHDAILSEVGQSLHDRLLSSVTEQVGGKYQRLGAGETIEV